jgi:hypothetical protein
LTSKALGAKQRVNQVAEDEDGGDAGDDVVHNELPVFSFQFSVKACRRL